MSKDRRVQSGLMVKPDRHLFVSRIMQSKQLQNSLQYLQAGMAHYYCGWTCGYAGKTARSLENTHHTWALLWWCFTTKRRYIKCFYPFLTLLVGRQEGHPACKKNWMSVMIWLELCTTCSSSGPVVTITSIILCFNKHWLTQVHLENGRLNRRKRDYAKTTQPFSQNSVDRWHMGRVRNR